MNYKYLFVLMIFINFNFNKLNADLQDITVVSYAIGSMYLFTNLMFNSLDCQSVTRNLQENFKDITNNQNISAELSKSINEVYQNCSYLNKYSSIGFFIAGVFIFLVLIKFLCLERRRNNLIRLPVNINPEENA